MRRVFSKSSFHAESSHFCFIPITSLLHPRAIIPHTQGRKGGTQHGEANFLSGGGLSAGLPAANESAQTVSVTVGSNSPAADDASAAGQLLFPELSDTDITGIRIHANDDCEFDFSVRGELSVNGQKADEEVFSTLVDQLTADSFTLCDDFEPQNDALLTVTVYTDTQDFSASFYQEQGDDKYAYVVAGADNERFLKTDAWRVGTLLLTCEGTRIFDASGQETPVD